jgi:hypothetical protein
VSDKPNGWYPHEDGSGRVVFHNDGRWLDPFIVMEEEGAEMMTAALERVFSAGFEAGFAAAKKI